jgi:hypothetical protein
LVHWNYVLQKVYMIKSEFILLCFLSFLIYFKQFLCVPIQESVVQNPLYSSQYLYKRLERELLRKVN